jgi:hypothetical protein
MQPVDFHVEMYDSGVHTLINSVLNPLVAFTDSDALDALTGYVQVYIAQAGSLDLAVNKETIQAFILHAQRVAAIDVEFLDRSFANAVLNSIQLSPPTAPPDLFLADVGSGVVNASSNLGADCDSYELQWKNGDTWETVGQGTVVDTQVNYQHTSAPAGTQEYRVIARFEGYASFPGGSESIAVA